MLLSLVGFDKVMVCAKSVGAVFRFLRLQKRVYTEKADGALSCAYVRVKHFL